MSICRTLLLVATPLFACDCRADDPASSSTASTANWFFIASEVVHDEALAEPHDVQLHDDLAFVPGKGGSIAIVNVAEPEKPELIWYRYDPKALANAETVLPLGEHLLLGSRDFHSIDVSNASKPSFLTTISDRDRIDRLNGMVKRRDYVFAANKTGWINVFDVSDVAAPTLMAALEVRDAYGLKKPHDIDLIDDYVVIVDCQDFAGPIGKLAIFKAWDGEGQLLAADQWELAGKIEAKELIGANRLQISGQYALVGGSWMPEAREQLPHEVSSDLAVVDLSEPTRPQVVTSIAFSDWRGPNGLTIAGNVVFLAGGQTIDAIDISNPRKPILVGSQTISSRKSGPDNAHDLVYRDGYLFVSCQSENSLIILKVSDQKILTLAGP